MKKLYIQPQTDVCETLPAQMLAGSVTAPDQGIGFKGDDTAPGAGADVKGNEWGDIWD